MSEDVRAVDVVGPELRDGRELDLAVSVTAPLPPLAAARPDPFFTLPGSIVRFDLGLLENGTPPFPLTVDVAFPLSPLPVRELFVVSTLADDIRMLPPGAIAAAAAVAIAEGAARPRLALRLPACILAGAGDGSRVGFRDDVEVSVAVRLLLPVTAPSDGIKPYGSG